MKKKLLLVMGIVSFAALSAQVPDPSLLIQVHHAQDSNMRKITGADTGQMVYNLTDSLLYIYTGASWIRQYRDSGTGGVINGLDNSTIYYITESSQASGGGSTVSIPNRVSRLKESSSKYGHYGNVF